MPTYVYGCDDRDHQKKEVVHRMADDPEVKCDQCGRIMHRVPQATMFYFNPVDTLHAMIDKKHEASVRRKEAQKKVKINKAYKTT